MQRSVRKFFLLINLLTLLCLTPCQATNELDDSLTIREYQFLMQARGHELTGLCIVNEVSEDTVMGTIVNEFGVKAFDFSIDNGKGRVFNVIRPLDKWYIRRVLKGDFGFIFNNMKRGQDLIIKKRHLSFMPNGEIHVRNEKYKIRYTFTPMKTNNEIDK